MRSIHPFYPDDKFGQIKDKITEIQPRKKDRIDIIICSDDKDTKLPMIEKPLKKDQTTIEREYQSESESGNDDCFKKSIIIVPKDKNYTPQSKKKPLYDEEQPYRENSSFDVDRSDLLQN